MADVCALTESKHLRFFGEPWRHLGRGDLAYCFSMRQVALVGLLFFSLGLLRAQSTIRQVDFKNFTYPLSGSLLGHGELKWLGGPKDGYSKRKPIHLVKGKDLDQVGSYIIEGKEYPEYAGFTLQSVKFADVTGEGKEDAIVTIRYDTGGTENTHYIYIYSLEGGKPTLVAYCHTGTRGFSGLYKTYGERGQLVIELLDPGKMQGECCSTGFVRTRFQWHRGKFEPVGKHEYGDVPLGVSESNKP